MEASGRNKASGEEGAVENLYPRLVNNHLCRGLCCSGDCKVFRPSVYRIKGILGSSMEAKSMRVIKAIPYVFCGFLSMGLVAFSSASVIVLSDIAKERTITAISINLPISEITNIDLRAL